jgi:hypothetical protein
VEDGGRQRRHMTARNISVTDIRVNSAASP